MRYMRGIIRALALLLTALIVLTAIEYYRRVEKNSDEWLNRATNIRLADQSKITLQGTVYDSAMTRLSWSDEVGTRSYIQDDAMRLALCHTLGDQKGMNATGVEYRFATTLLGMDITRTDYMMQVITGNQPTGYDLVLTVNAQLSAYIMSLFPEGYYGAAVITNYKTGAILAKVSIPYYDPVNVSPATDTDTSYFDRVTQIRYAPGSTFKTITLASALLNDGGLENETFDCGGTWNLGKYSINCASGAVHGALSLRDAFAKSCNVTFSRIAYQTGGRALKQTAESFGFNTEFAFSDLQLNQSRCLENGFNGGEVIQAGIGQGTTLVTPLHMAMISGAIANGGVMMEPWMIKEVRKHNGETISAMHTAVYKTACSPELSVKLAQYMYYTVQSGTGTRAQIPGYSAGYVCGKTGSAEWTNDKTKATHAWYTGFLYGDDAHPYAISVIVEKGGSGGSTAAPIASKALARAIELGVY